MTAADTEQQIVHHLVCIDDLLHDHVTAIGNQMDVDTLIRYRNELYRCNEEWNDALHKLTFWLARILHAEHAGERK